ncbi:MAG: SpoIID/LytB domain-containing protein [Patescibacteria group bacterium]
MADSVTITNDGELQMEPGEVKEVSVTFQNSGSATWYNDGAGYISLYTYGPKYRKSVFDPGTWLGPDRVKRIREAVVKPGETASMVFELHAPMDEGSYQESFKLASEDKAWVEGGDITLNIQVAPRQEEQVQVDDQVDQQDGYEAQLVLQSADRVKIKAGKSVLITVGFKNTGTKTWNAYSLNEMDVALASTSINFNHPSWSGSRLAYATSQVKPGEIAYLDFAIMAPSVNGTHMAEFQFKANDVSVDNAIFELPVEVTDGAVVASNDTQDDAILQDYKEQEEPMLRVGILIVDEETDNEVVITCEDDDFELRDTEGNILAELDAGVQVTAYYASGKYYYDIGRGTEVSSYGLRFIPSVENAVMTVTNFDYRETRNSKYAYNTYRNIIELRYNDYKDRTWLINELPIEMYLRGLAETSNASPHEYQKALITAARTYAYYHYYHGTKRGKEFMHVVGYSDDQVYRGYEHEVQSPTIVQAVIDTRGMVVTYEDALAITPYFSRSAGETYDWSEVWGGSVPWCVGVSVPWDDGKTLWGHGIGMSASGALGMANDGYQWDEILQYFYTGIEVQQWWE